MFFWILHRGQNVRLRYDLHRAEKARGGFRPNIRFLRLIVGRVAEIRADNLFGRGNSCGILV